MMYQLYINKKIINVACYCRVSTLSEEQELSFNNQKEYYETLVKNNSNYNLIDIYADKGISGTIKDRPELNRLINDCRLHKIDLIITKSISRFNRNSINNQELLYELKELDVEVYFEKENLSSFNRTSEMILNMMSIISESESKSLSQSIRWSLDYKASRGIRLVGSNHIYGYDEVDGKLVPNDNSKYVKLIFKLFNDGYKYSQIVSILNELNIKSLRNKEFTSSTIRKMLSNEIYCGDRFIQKNHHSNYLTKKPDYNEEYDSYYIEDDHKAIVDKELFIRVQERIRNY